MTMRSGSRVLVSLALLGISAGLLSTPLHGQQPMGATGVTVSTWQYNTHRTGQNPNETVLLYNNLSTSNFGQLCSQQLDGQVYAQPLVVTGVTINKVRYNYVVYVVTQNGSVYALNGDVPANGGCSVLLQNTTYAAGQYPVDCNYIGGENCATIAPFVGILSTPVININSQTHVGTD